MKKPHTKPFLADDIKDPYPKIYRVQKQESLLMRAAKSTKNIFTKAKPDRQIPVTIFTGYLGAGKTTVITNLMQSMPDGYKIAWLKNEMGNTAVDTELANGTHVTMTKEILQGCLCHTMIGSLQGALEELLASKPDRIIIEGSGSATPAPIVLEIRKNEKFIVDGVVTVIDAQNFTGYRDKSPTLKIQARYTDLILINKHEELEERTLEDNLDDLYDINLDTPKIFTRHGKVSPDLVFGLDSALFETTDSVHTGDTDHHHHEMEVELVECTPQHPLTIDTLTEDLKKLPGKKFYRIKGIVETHEGHHIINCAFGTCTITPLASKKQTQPRIVMMGEQLLEHQSHILKTFDITEQDLHYTPKHDDDHHHHDHDHDHHH